MEGVCEVYESIGEAKTRPTGPEKVKEAIKVAGLTHTVHKLIFEVNFMHGFEDKIKDSIL